MFYNAKYKNELFFKERFDKIATLTSRFKVYYVLKEEQEPWALHGQVTLNTIKDKLTDDTSIFISTNEEMLKYLNKELEPLKYPKKYIRYIPVLPKSNIRKIEEYKLTVCLNNENYEIKCYNNKTIMEAILESGFYIPSECHKGICGLCRSQLVSGKVKIINDKRLEGDKKYNYIHPCTTYPASDIKIIVR